ncbi:hypothetical protein SPRG_10956 [Saprolegnia parasitica CBS 223.65]|uniref:Orn/DAP/Arg decarboxylase 2 N-terminal domain-containing protein n=1 Tax=Saprolegnia parasitica (strain CBS 223.65) TaxID=695850 RepID=A0A067BV40_SAPPC|nr:hypothetical protein SPRG_10956 [Saprolegnia parasitica CBS 223.65]KDO22138.1 hypothetical protein SPRG_10956 [Saprolegnia parasitica CBS 223.65]|eukprot:XP_012207176.1 hypothetical protein SPRG_10956 [Saprolegnia parasitica CBS 223.65]
MASTKLHRRVLRKSVELYRPELLPLFLLFHKSETSHEWEIQHMADAVKLSTFLHSKMLLSPELNRNSPCYIARRIVQLYIKLKYIATFPAHEIDEYAAIGDQEYDEVRMMHHLLHNSGTATTETEHVYRLAAMLGISYHGDSWQEILTFVRCALPFAEQTETLLIRGSDDRSILDNATQTNKYNTTTIPCAVPQHAWISRASCTSSSVALDGYTVCERIRQELLLSSLSINNENIHEVFDRKMQSVRDRVAACLGLRALYDDGAFECVISPSGTDAELLATSVALARLASVASETTNGRMTLIVTAGGETGSGSVAASNGKHFSKLSPSGDAVEPGKLLRGFPTAKVHCVQIPARQDDGHVENADATVRASVIEALSTSPTAAHNVVLLHVVMGSKTGLCCPSLSLVDELSAMYSTRLIVVIDACQMRLDKLSLVEYMARGYLVLITGSKFFAGVPFCGGVLIPSVYIDELEGSDDLGSIFPIGYTDYFSKYEFPPLSMPLTRDRFASRMNVGLLLRWETALVNMELYASIPSAMVGQICYEYIARSKAMMATHAHVSLLEPPRDLRKPSMAADGTLLQPLDTIISFHVIEHGVCLSVDRLKLVHMFLSKDISSVITETCPLEVALASKKCLVGQPVTLGKLAHGVLRIALGADMVNHIYRGTKTMVELVLEDAIVLRKLALILNHWDPLCAKFVDVPVTHHLPSTPPKPESKSIWDFSVKAACRSPALRSLLASGHELFPRMVLYDLDGVDGAFQSLVAPFPAHFEHRFHVSSCPLAFFLRRAIENDIGLTCASIVEVQHALRLGCAPHKIAFTSPVKTRRELAYAMDMGVEVNADSFEELEIIKEHAQMRFQSSFPECTPRYAGELPRIGVRVHVCHEAAHTWMAGISLTSDNRAKLLGMFKEHPWLTGLVLATCPKRADGNKALLHEIADGANQLCDLANDIDAVAGETRVKVLNVGGDLDARYDADDVGLTFADVVEVLHAEAPKLFERNGRTVVTEHGDYISAKVGWTASEVEYIRFHGAPDDRATPTQTAVIDAGADVHTRLPNGSYKHRVSVYKANGQLSAAPKELQSAICLGEPLHHEWSARVMTVPRLERGDYVALHDTGANMTTMGHGANGQPAPPVFGYRRHDDGVHVVLLKAAETPEQVMQLWS